MNDNDESSTSAGASHDRKRARAAALGRSADAADDRAQDTERDALGAATGDRALSTGIAAALWIGALWYAAALLRPAGGVSGSARDVASRVRDAIAIGVAIPLVLACGRALVSDRVRPACSRGSRSCGRSFVVRGKVLYDDGVALVVAPRGVVGATP